MPDSGTQTGTTTGPTIPKSVVRTLLPWYRALVAIYAPVHVLYGWLQSSGVYQGSWHEALFNLCVVAGIAAFVAPAGAFFGGILGAVLSLPVAGILAAFGHDFIESAKQVIRYSAILVATVFALVMIYITISTPRYIPDQLAPNGSDKFYAITGAIVLIVIYGVYGRKAFDWIKRFKADIKEQA